MEREFSVVIEKDEEVFRRFSADITGCHTQAKSLDVLMKSQGSH